MRSRHITEISCCEGIALHGLGILVSENGVNLTQGVYPVLQWNASMMTDVPALTLSASDRRSNKHGAIVIMASVNPLEVL